MRGVAEAAYELERGLLLEVRGERGPSPKMGVWTSHESPHSV